MKHGFTILGLLIGAISFGQTNSLNGTISQSDVKTSGMKISVSVDSAEDLKNTFDINDIEEAIDRSSEVENISFEIICKDDSTNKAVTKSVTYKAKGRTNAKESFLKSVKRIRKAAIKYYNLKN